jgi:NAD-dependent SIR2 family protein deacetylase
MTAEPEHASALVTRCWCCGEEFPEAELVRLGQHPEVGVCLNCAAWLRRRAVLRRDEQHPSPAGRVRARIHAVREMVIKRGWHERGRLGAVLRWLDRHLP